MSLLETINKLYKVNKQSFERMGLQDSSYWDGLWIHEYIEEYLPEGTLNPQYADFRTKPFSQRGYYFLGHGNNLSFNLTGESTEVVADSTKEKLYLKGNVGLEISVDLVTKFNKLLAKLGIFGTLLNKPERITDFLLGTVKTPAPTPSKNGSKAESIFEIPSAIEVVLLRTLTGLKFAYGTTAITLTQVMDRADLANDTFFIDQKNNQFLLKLATTTQKEGILSLTYTGEIDEVIVGYGGESKDMKFFNIVQIYNDKQSGKVSYREVFKCVANPSRNITFRGQNTTDGGSTQTLTFNACEDISRPAGEQLFIEKDDWDLSLNGA